MLDVCPLRCGCVAPGCEAGCARALSWREATMELRNMGAACPPPPTVPNSPQHLDASRSPTESDTRRFLTATIGSPRSHTEPIAYDPRFHHVQKQLRQRLGDVLASGSHLPGRIRIGSCQARFGRGGRRQQDTCRACGDQGTPRTFSVMTANVLIQCSEMQKSSRPIRRRSFR